MTALFAGGGTADDEDRKAGRTLQGHREAWQH